MMTAMLTVRNIQASKKVYDIWQGNEEAPYNEAGRDGALTDGERAALASERAVPVPAAPLPATRAA